jgi:transcriptional regulator with XRE-family HTH domain
MIELITNDQLRDGRKLLGWSVQALANTAGVSVNAIQKLEYGLTNLERAQFGTVYRLVRALELGGIEFLSDGRVIKKAVKE